MTKIVVQVIETQHVRDPSNGGCWVFTMKFIIPNESVMSGQAQAAMDHICDHNTIALDTDTSIAKLFETQRSKTPEKESQNQENPNDPNWGIW